VRVARFRPSAFDVASTAAPNASVPMSTPFGVPVVPEVYMAYTVLEEGAIGAARSALLLWSSEIDTNGTRPHHCGVDGSSRASTLITRAGAQSASMVANRASGSVVASGTKIAPIHRLASAATTNSTELGRKRATRSPSTTPWSLRPVASRTNSSSSSA
jgi:hypothetical protein